ncbi:hypothetical protein Nmel_008557, partial [Mimus melanotis]
MSCAQEPCVKTAVLDILDWLPTVTSLSPEAEQH